MIHVEPLGLCEMDQSPGNLTWIVPLQQHSPLIAFPSAILMIHPSIHTHTNTAGVPSSRLSIYTPIFTESLLLLLSVLFYRQQVIR